MFLPTSSNDGFLVGGQLAVLERFWDVLIGFLAASVAVLLAGGFGEVVVSRQDPPSPSPPCTLSLLARPGE